MCGNIAMSGSNS